MKLFYSHFASSASNIENFIQKWVTGEFKYHKNGRSARLHQSIKKYSMGQYGNYRGVFGWWDEI